MAYLTGLDNAPSQDARRVFIPDDLRTRAAILGAILELTNPENWEETDGITVNEQIEIIWNFYESLSLFEDCP